MKLHRKSGIIQVYHFETETLSNIVRKIMHKVELCERGMKIRRRSTDKIQCYHVYRIVVQHISNLYCVLCVITVVMFISCIKSTIGIDPFNDFHMIGHK